MSRHITATNAKNGRVKAQGYEYGDFVTIDGCLYQIRGNGNHPQLYLVSSEQAEIEATQLDASYRTQ